MQCVITYSNTSATIYIAYFKVVVKVKVFYFIFYHSAFSSIRSKTFHVSSPMLHVCSSTTILYLLLTQDSAAVGAIGFWCCQSNPVSRERGGGLSHTVCVNSRMLWEHLESRRSQEQQMGTSE